ncbi:uncharacterized protein LOC124359331 isoform X2 [Homalodisca vitripennis]|nr:uncharacterized protein LOC124359331 isoform X2 [Homalodisca vitripennis]XP_046667950.1 uncharacterized protein LOC124359331 isoform X2 [Homalodisca vitripennis]XP_046667951.1 uncharacterized protein LOC124359331 isoform X2 [Homalodisca vitripennis]
MSAHVNQDQSTRMFKVVAIGSTEEYILGDTVEPVIPEPGLKYDADKLEDVQVKCKTEPEDTDSKKNVIQDLVKLVKLEHSGNLLEENPFMILQNEPPWDDDDLERKLDQFTNELKNKERKLKSHKMTTDAISSPQVKFQSNDVHPRSIRRNLVQTKLKFPKVEDTNMTLRRSPRKVSVVCKNNELKKSLGVNKEQQCKIPLKSLEIIEIDESSSDNDREENCISEHMEDKSDTQHRSTNSKSPSNVSINLIL